MSSKRGVATKFKSLGTKWKLFAVLGILTLAIGVPVGIWAGITAYNTMAIGSETGPTAQPYSYVYVYDWTSNENLNETCPIGILVNDKTLTEPDEIYDISNYKSLVTEEYPEVIKEDLSSYDYAIFITNPDEATDGYWTLDHKVVELEGNSDFILYAKHESTDIYGNILDRDSGTEWAGATNGNFSTFLWFPYVTTTEYHQGPKWDIYDEIADLSATTLKKLKNENEWRCQPTIFDLTVDQADHDRTGDYLLITETSALEFDFNDTIGASDSVTGLNITVDCDINYMVEYGAGSNADKLYIVFTETWDCVNGDFTLDFDITMGANLTASNVKAGRISILGRYFNDVAPTFTSLQTLV